ncbi:MAG: DNA-binding protein [Deltaproteobacteria bacterium]|nr:DNA-binding protein [Deltaproteobacteria bacterium]
MTKSRKHSFLVLRLNPDEDLKKKIASICEKNKIMAGAVVSVVGSLKNLNIRLANSNAFLKREEKMEVLSLQGSISVSGVHLHISVADSKGNVMGGHLMDENLIFTTLEMVILIFEDLIFDRKIDNHTGYKELIINGSNLS